MRYYVTMFKEIQKPYYNSVDDPLGQFIPIEDGVPVLADVEALEAYLRREAVKYMGVEALRSVGRTSARLGKALIYAADRALYPELEA